MYCKMRPVREDGGDICMDCGHDKGVLNALERIAADVYREC